MISNFVVKIIDGEVRLVIDMTTILSNKRRAIGSGMATESEVDGFFDRLDEELKYLRVIAIKQVKKL